MEQLTKKRLVKISDYIWEVPKSYRSDMRVPARIFASAEMLEELFKDRSLWQLVNITTLPGIYRCALAMPDVHEGYGAPVGGVFATNPQEQGIISPGAIGYDINCGVRLLVSSLQYEEVKHQLPKLTETIFKEVPAGVGRGGWWQLSKDEMKGVLEQGAKYLLAGGYARPQDLEATESSGMLGGASADLVSEIAKARGRDQIGTMGAGNHFVEIQRVQEIFDQAVASKLGLEQGRVAVLIHCGSRGLGHQVATDYIRLMLKALPKYGIELADRELAGAPFNSPEGQNYFAAMKAAANFAWANRQLIAYEVRQAFEKIFGKEIELNQVYDVAHNIAKIENYEGRELIVHRKGATRAFPLGQVELTPKFRQIGQPVIIPGSMGTSSYVLMGQDKAMEISFGSTCHGAGRLISRSQAKKQVRGAELKQELEARGISIVAGSMTGLAEEAPLAYKDVSQVVDVVHNLGIAKKVTKLVPIGVIKG